MRCLMKIWCYLTYDERLIKLGNDRLELRRLREDLLMCYKILHHSVDLHQEDFFTMSSVIKTRGNSYKLIVPNSRINARTNYFSVRIINVSAFIWNPLAFHLLITKLLTQIWNLDLLVSLSSTLIIIIFNVLLILLSCVTKLCRYLNRYIRILFVFYRIM